MSNEETGKLIGLVEEAMNDTDPDQWVDLNSVAVAIVGELQSRYRIEPLENTAEEEKT